MASVICNKFKLQLSSNTISLSADNWYCALVTSAITLSSTEQLREVNNWNELSALEVVGSGYTAKGKLLTNTTHTLDRVNNRAEWDADNVVWTSTSLSAVRGAVIYLSGAEPVAGFIDFGENKQTENASFNLNWSDEGILNIN